MSLIDADTGEVVDSSPSATARPWAIVERLAGPESGTVRSRLSQLEHTGLAVKVGTALGTRGAMNTAWRATDAGVAIVANAEDDA